MKADDEGYGTITVGFGKPEQRELKIVNFVKSRYKGDRLASCCELEDGSYCIAIENVMSSGRNLQNVVWLSKESFAGFFANATLYVSLMGLDLVQMTKEALEGETIQYTFSDNLTEKAASLGFPTEEKPQRENPDQPPPAPKPAQP